MDFEEFFIRCSMNIQLLAEFCRLNDIAIPDSGYFSNNEYEEKFRKFVLQNMYLPAIRNGKDEGVIHGTI